MEVFFPVSEDERDALLSRSWAHPELSGLERIAWDPAGVDEDAVWMAAEVPDEVVQPHEDPDGRYMGYRPITLPRVLLNGLAWRVVPLVEVAAARQAEAEAMRRASEQHRAEALREGRRLGLTD